MAGEPGEALPRPGAERLRITAIGPPRRAEPGETSCPLCTNPIAKGQRLILVRSAVLGHCWVHLRHAGQPDLTAADPEPLERS